MGQGNTITSHTSHEWREATQTALHTDWWDSRETTPARPSHTTNGPRTEMAGAHARKHSPTTKATSLPDPWPTTAGDYHAKQDQQTGPNQEQQTTPTYPFTRHSERPPERTPVPRQEQERTIRTSTANRQLRTTPTSTPPIPQQEREKDNSKPTPAKPPARPTPARQATSPPAAQGDDKHQHPPPHAATPTTIGNRKMSLNNALDIF